jgi:hypothetical protein
MYVDREEMPLEWIHNYAYLETDIKEKGLDPL